MIGKMIGAIIGGNIAEKTRGVNGTTGALVGAAVPAMIARLSIPTMLAMGVGGYFLKKHLDKKAAEDGTTPATPSQSGANPTPATA
ncbi:hypothetical protein LY632_02020 [Erythrobacter sp. SDW2]|uniref:hypothetical protein n=1 Tax=Erythrobacter sp. SDW2 TaxID=2907154 RepID=UPI001F16B780|nr:hypothetical protein [Erythrobacter sp. SDW2]UIP07201.1 hypothetical protein LY632_02020 [Erythrobacter sp. SDW2]